jgi:hypothetical protein
MIMQLTKTKYAVVPALLMLWLSSPLSALSQSTTLGTFIQADQPAPSLTRLDLDFPGGTPKELVAAIQKSMGKPLNVIIPDEFADTKIPALKMKNVDVPQLFQAIEAASSKQQYITPSPGSAQYVQTFRYGFRPNTGAVTDDTIWYFHVEKPIPSVPFKDCRFYSLAPYLDRGLTVDDITTAIKTGAKMLGENQEPQISFHKDTKLLIAVGEPSKLQIIDAVLKALEPIKSKPVPAEKKAEDKSP